MGSWNQTCGLTHVPIFAGEPVRVVFLRQNWDWYYDSRPDGTVYPTDLWQPIGLPLLGRYDDYGRAQEVESGTAAECVLDYFREHHGELFAEVTPSTLCHALIEHEELAYTGGSGPSLRYGYMLIPEPIYQDFLQAVGESRDRWFGSDEPSVREHTEAMVQEYIQGHRMNRLDSGTDAVKRALRSHLESDSPLPGALRSVVQSKWILECLRKDELFATPLVDLLIFLEGLGLTRRTLMPQSGQGSQDDALGVHKALARAAREHIERQRRALRG